MGLSFVTLLCVLWKRPWLIPLSSILRLAEQIRLGGGGKEGLLLFGKGRDPQIGREASGVIRKLESGASPLNPAAGAPESYVGPWRWLLWLGFHTGTKAGESTFHNQLTEQARIEIGSKFKVNNS